ncbi:hypothetical protein RQP46_003044 [Phenoliferia psychrophenolica]
MPTVAELESFTRVKLQALSKDNNLKANGKTEVLLAQLVQHYGLNGQVASGPAPASKKVAAKRKVNKASSVPPPALAEDPENDEDDDEMRMGTPAAVKKTKALPGAGGKKAAEAAAQSAAASSSNQAGAARLSGASDAPAPTYGTSPGTKAAIKDIQATLNHLRTDLASSRDELSTVRTSLADTDARAASNLAAVYSRIDQEIATIREEQHAGNEGQADAIGQLEGLREQLQGEVEKGAEGRRALLSKMDGIQGQVEQLEGHSTTLEAFEGVESRLTTVESSLSAAAAKAAEQQPSTSTPAAITASGSGGPVPSQSLDISSPPSSRSGSRHNSPSSRSSPRKQPATATTTALPSHMLYTARRAPSPTKTSSSTVFLAPAPAPSPAPAAASLVDRARVSLGKHARYSDSDASELSIDVAADVSPPPPSTASIFDRPVAGRPRSASTGSVGHARKRIRVSGFSGAGDQTVDADEDDEEEEEEEEQEAQDGPDTTAEDSRFADDSLAMQSADDASLSLEGGDESYFVATKGDESTNSVDPFTLPSISDPTFFAAPAASTSTHSSRKSLQAPATAIAPGALHPRKSLPIGSLPYPLVSSTTKSFFAAPRPSLVDFGNRASGSGSGSSSAASAIVPPTPQASKTLYGTERIIGDAGGGSDDDDEDFSGMGSRFEDDAEFTTFGVGGGAIASPVKKWGSGAWAGFGSAA